jgi:hypothetical protein
MGTRCYPQVENCTLREAFTGRLIARLTRSEGESMVREGTARRNGHKYTLISHPHPSNSEETAPSLMKYDTMVVASGGAPTIEEFERLVGWGFHVSRPQSPQLA